MQAKHHKINWLTATSLVVANMVGTGVFTSLGFQLAVVQNTWSIVLLWIFGGVLALIGAFSMAELGTHYPNENGGDYVFISKALHPFFGYLSAFVSLVAGFSAPVAIAAIAMEAYLGALGWPHLRILSVVVVVLIGLLHSFSVHHSSRFQNITTLSKILFIACILGVGIGFAPVSNPATGFYTSFMNEALSTPFAVSLLYVTYAYTGWNAAAYIVAEIQYPQRNLPKALLTGTLAVTVVYVLLQLVFLKFASVSQLSGQADVAVVAFRNVFGEVGAKCMSVGIAVQLVATMSSYVWVGSRVSHRMAQDYPLWQLLHHQNMHGIPVRAVWLQTGITLVLMFSGSLQEVLLYTSFVLQLMGTLAVASLLNTPRKPNTYHSPLRPYLQYLYIVFSLGVLSFMMYNKPKESFIGLGIVGVGGLTYFWGRKPKNNSIST